MELTANSLHSFRPYHPGELVKEELECRGIRQKAFAKKFELSYSAFNEILTYIIHSGFISGYQNRYGDNLKPPTNVYHRMTA